MSRRSPCSRPSSASIRARPIQADRSSRLYLVTPPRLDPNGFTDTLAATLDAGDVACVQLRLKDVPDAVIRAAVERLLPVCRAREVAFILNDRADLAAALDCDGVHVGQDDAPYDEARRLVGADRIVGVTCHDSRHLAMVAAEAGADYVAFGAFFPSETKVARTRADPDILGWWQEFMTVPCVAIGGITVANAATVVAAGADFIAVSSGVWDYPAGPAQAIVDFNGAIARALEAAATR